jgi:hypothetical protein
MSLSSAIHGGIEFRRPSRRLHAVADDGSVDLSTCVKRGEQDLDYVSHDCARWLPLGITEWGTNAIQTTP